MGSEVIQLEKHCSNGSTTVEFGPDVICSPLMKFSFLSSSKLKASNIAVGYLNFRWTCLLLSKHTKKNVCELSISMYLAVKAYLEFKKGCMWFVAVVGCIIGHIGGDKRSC